VAELFTDIVKSTEHNEATAGAKVTLGGKEVAKTEETLYSQQYFQEILKTELSNGAAVMLSTKLTGGHIVMLTQVLDDGIVINDPYGMRLTNGYVKNGAANDKALRGRLTAETADIDVRLRENADLRATLTAWTETSGTNMPQNMGEKNFYTWAQVTTWKIGKWNNIVRGS
jgi:hypothetical protein